MLKSKNIFLKNFKKHDFNFMIEKILVMYTEEDFLHSFFFSSCALFPKSACEKRLRHPPLLLFCISALTYLKFVAESQNLIPKKSVCGGIFFISPRPLFSTKVMTLKNAFLKHTQIKIALQGYDWKHLCGFCP